MKKSVLALAVFMMMLAGLGLAGGEDKFGIAVYPGAAFDEATTKFLVDAMSVEAYCCRTNDSVAKVIAFYKAQPGLNLIDESAEGGMFKKGNVDVTIQNPWMDMKTGKQNKDTLISIVKQKE
jgi:hypothetical protein